MWPQDCASFGPIVYMCLYEIKYCRDIKQQAALLNSSNPSLTLLPVYDAQVRETITIVNRVGAWN